MYVITKLLSGKFHCAFRLQDGTEYYTYDTVEEAVKSAKEFARYMNGDKNLKKKDIAFLEEQRNPVVQTTYVPWNGKS
jgi:hypothetical protein